MLIYLSAGEHSGDIHGANLAAALLKRQPDLQLFGMGGPLMQKAGVEIIHDPTRKSTIGFVEALKGLRGYQKLLQRITALLTARRPDAVVWIDFGGFNLSLAKVCRQMNIPVVCVFSPSAWAYGRKRAVLMAERLTELAAVLPFEADFYRSFGIKTTFVGHPLLDSVHAELGDTALRKLAGVGEDDKILALLPGSRLQEIKRLLPVMLEAVGVLRREGRDFQAILPLAPSVPGELVNELIKQSGQAVQVMPGHAHDLLAACTAAAIASGTATLEAAIIGAPHVSIYRLNRLTLIIYKLLATREMRKRPSTNLPNLVAGRRIIPELLQDELRAATLAKELARIFDDRTYRAEMIAALGEVRQALGEPGAMGRVAEIVLGTAKGERQHVR